MKPTFNQTVNVLVQAYLNDTLSQGECAKCAVANIISEGNVRYDFYLHGESWFKALGLNTAHPSCWNPEHPDVLKTKYNASDLIKIERAFERGDDVFGGLMAVVDVLADIHSVDLEQKESAKLLFQ